MRFILTIGLFLAGCVTTQPTKAPAPSWPVHFCETIPGTSAHYCEEETGSNPTDTLWFFHGLGDSDQVWNTTNPIPSAYPVLKAALPNNLRIITISFSRPMQFGSMNIESGWLLTDYGTRTQPPLDATISTFRDKIVPYIENKFQVHGPYKLLSHSMGTSNAIKAMMAMPTMWSKAVLWNGALLTDKTDPWNVIQICPWCLMIKYNYDTKAQWLADRPEPIKGMPKTLVTGCPVDIFGLYSADKEFYTKSKAMGNDVIFADDPAVCSHWEVDIPNVIGFLGF